MKRRTKMWLAIIVPSLFVIGGIAWVGTNMLLTRQLDLHTLVQIGDWEGIDWIIRYAGSRVNEVGEVSVPGYKITNIGKEVAVNQEKLTPLCVAIRAGQTDHVPTLITAGADVSLSKGEGGNTPLIWALIAQDEASILALLSAGADVNVPNGMGMTPIFYAQNAKQARLLVQHGARLDIPAACGDTPLLWTLGTDPLTAYLIEAGADVNYLPPGGETALDVAELYGHLDSTRELLRNNGAKTSVELKLEQKRSQNKAADGDAASP